MAAAVEQTTFGFEGQRYRAEIHGNGSDEMLFLPGLFTGPGSYRSIGQAIGGYDNGRAVVVEMPGLAGAPPFEGPCTAERYTRFVDIARRSLGMEPGFVVGGHSMGGGLALAYAMSHPGNVRGVMAFNPKTTVNEFTFRVAMRGLAGVDIDTQAKVVLANLEDLQSSFHILDRDLPRLPGKVDELATYVRDVAARFDPRGIADRVRRTTDAVVDVLKVVNMACSLDVSAGAETLRRAKVPVSMFLGRNDPLIQYEDNVRFTEEAGGMLTTFDSKHLLGSRLPQLCVPFVLDEWESMFSELMSSHVPRRPARFDETGSRVVATETVAHGLGLGPLLTASGE